MADAACIACGCTDSDGCLVKTRDGANSTCSWVVVDRKTNRGVCSTLECRTELQRWDGGSRELSEKAKERLAQRGKHGR